MERIFGFLAAILVVLAALLLLRQGPSDEDIISSLSSFKVSKNFDFIVLMKKDKEGEDGSDPSGCRTMDIIMGFRAKERLSVDPIETEPYLKKKKVKSIQGYAVESTAESLEPTYTKDELNESIISHAHRVSMLTEPMYCSGFNEKKTCIFSAVSDSKKSYLIQSFREKIRKMAQIEAGRTYTIRLTKGYCPSIVGARRVWISRD